MTAMFLAFCPTESPTDALELWVLGGGAVAMAGLFAGLVVRRSRFMTGKARAASGHCVSCGYDLNRCPAGTPCPECGGQRPV